MTADDLWEKYASPATVGGTPVYIVTKREFLAALAERDAYVKKECVRVCREVATERMPATTQGFCITNDGLGCAVAIEKLEIK